ncbi:competence protein CoiA [Ureibacillus chungkukjangi]|uniref:competence protein CoiA n=1 Tax=Ureibacillus chungkukjangi TaxID=1202712 RepID=UPI00203ADC27|nr:competence protein CoiA [Ureibacillus chungkukjangi]MCM3387310.1 competence protein CoiA [Ureibacillus chungkukjangi]
MEVNLWFARNSDNEIVSILDSHKENTYHCPICTSKVIPKALESKKMTPHFAHVDVSKCNGEAMIHWWYKNKFIQSGDTFKIVTDNEIEFTCKDFDTEVTYQLESGTYRPDLVVYTECGQEIIFEMANANKKMVKDYIDRWIELDKIIVEVDIMSLTNSLNNEKKFNALYYCGKCFNFNERDGGYYETIGKLKEDMKTKEEYDIEKIKRLDWFWDKLSASFKGEVHKEDLFKIMMSFKNTYELIVIKEILKKKKCNNLYEEFVDFLKEHISSLIEQAVEKYKENKYKFRIRFDEELYYGKLIDYKLSIDYKQDSIFKTASIINHDIDLMLIEERIIELLREEKIRQRYFEVNEITGKYLDNLEQELNLEEYSLCNYINPVNYKLQVGIKYNGTINRIIEIPDNYINFQDEDGYLYFYLRTEVLNFINSVNTMDNEKEIINLVYDITSKYDYYYLGYVNDKKVKIFIDYKKTAKDTLAITLRNYANKNTCHLYIKNNKIYHSDDYYFNKDIERYCDLLGDAKKLETSIIEYYYKLHFENIKCCINDIIDYKEFEFCFKNNYKMPKLCKSCRQKRKQGGTK